MPPTPESLGDTGSADLREFIAGGVWSSAPVLEEPEYHLVRWQVVECYGDRHFVGYNTTTRSGQVSSRVVTYDPTARRGVTQSGRVYELQGRPGFDVDADYVLRHWLHRNGYSRNDMRDVTALVLDSR